MIDKEMNRRFFLQGSGSLAGSSLMKVGLPAFIAASQAACSAREESAVFENITQAEAREIIALAARILPTTDTPGATEAGAVYFFDKAFGTFLAESIEMGRALLAKFQSGISDQYPGAQRFSDLDEKDQDAYLKANEESQFFFFVRFLTLAGVFGMSTWGGNRDDIGWKLVGMDSAPHAWTPPFGYYDAEHSEANSHGG